MTERKGSKNISITESENSTAYEVGKNASEVQQMDQGAHSKQLDKSPSSLRSRSKTHSEKQNSSTEFPSHHYSPLGQSSRHKLPNDVEKLPNDVEKLPNDVEMQSTPIADKTKKDNYGTYKGVLFAAFSSVFFSLSSVIVKYMTEIDPAQLALIRFVGILILSIPVMVYRQEEIFGPRDSCQLMLIRGVVGATNLFLTFYAFRYLPIADASVIVFSVPVFVAIFARIFLKEPCGIFHAVTIVITVLGVFLITKMPLVLAEGIVYSNERIYGISAAVGSTLFGAMVYVILRKIKDIHHSVIMFNFGWVAIIETTIITFLLGSFSLPRCGLNQWLVALLGIFSYGGQTFLTIALQAENAALVALVRAAGDVILAFIWQILFFQETTDIYSISGAILVSLCVVMVSVRKLVLSLPEESKTRQRLSWFIC